MALWGSGISRNLFAQNPDKLWGSELGDIFTPLTLNPTALYDSNRITGFSSTSPFLKVRRSVTGDEVDIYGFNPSEPRQYQTSAGGAYVTTESLLFPNEKFYVVTWYDQSGNAHNAAQATATNQPELYWEGSTFGSELIINGNMELDSNWINDVTPVTNERSSEQANDGTYSRKLVVDSQYDGIVSEYFSVTSGKHYAVSQSVYGDGTNKSFVRVTDTGGSSFYSPLSISAAGKIWPASWTTENWYFTANTTDTDYIFRLQSGTSVSAGTWYLDSVTIKEVLTWKYPVVKFDGINDFMTATGLSLTGSSNITVFSKIKPLGYGESSAGRVLTSNANEIDMRIEPTETYTFLVNNDAASEVDTTGVELHAYHNLFGAYNGSNTYGGEGDLSNSTAYATGYDAITSLNIGRWATTYARYCNGLAKSIIIYHGKLLNTTEVSKLNGFYT